MVVHVPWVEAARGFFIPTLSSNTTFWTVVVAIFGTTISPYLFFWQASQEVEEIKNVKARKPLARSPEQGPDAIERIKVDTYIGMAFSNLVALAIMFTTAATLHAAGTTDIQTSSQAAEALKPIAGPFAFAIFAMGVVGTGLLAVPVLAGSAAYAIGEAFKWPIGLDRKPKEARAFYGAIVVATFSGIAITISPLDPIKALFWSAVVNGLVAVPVMAMMMLIGSNERIMGKFAVEGALKGVGWLATAVMAAASIVMITTAVLGK
jgi:Mn2+/Fe2+ NRAMP family transporter